MDDADRNPTLSVEYSPPFDTAVPAARPLRILCAEDHAEMGLLTKLVLEREGHYVEHVTDGHAAWERVAMNPKFFDLIITDNQMPHLTGMDFVTRLHEAQYRIPVIVHSSCVDAEDERTFHELGVIAILRKPSNMQQLLAVVGQVRPK